MAFTEGYIYKKGMSPQTQTVVSTKNKIYSKHNGSNQMSQIGVVASFEPSDSRAVEAIRGIGYGDQIAELIPNASEPISISVTRSALYLSLLMQTFGYAAGSQLTTGYMNSLFGFSAGQYITSGAYNTFFGYAAGQLASGSTSNFGKIFLFLNTLYTSGISLLAKNSPILFLTKRYARIIFCSSLFL